MRRLSYKGVQIECFKHKDDYASVEARAEAPDGQVFCASGTHGVVRGLIGGGARELALCVASVKEDIDDGFEDCDQPDCDICADAREAKS